MGPKAADAPLHYGEFIDYTLDKLSEDVKQQKQDIISQIKIERPNQSFISQFVTFKNKKFAEEQYEKKLRCDRLIKMAKAIGTKHKLGQQFLMDEFYNLSMWLKSTKDEKLSLLCHDIYKLNKEVSRDFIFSFSFMDENIRIFLSSELKKCLIPDVANLVLEYSEEKLEAQMQDGKIRRNRLSF